MLGGQLVEPDLLAGGRVVYGGAAGVRYGQTAVVQPAAVQAGVAAQLLHARRVIALECVVPGAMVLAQRRILRLVVYARAAKVSQVLDASMAVAFDQRRGKLSCDRAHVADDGFATAF